MRYEDKRGRVKRCQSRHYNLLQCRTRLNEWKWSNDYLEAYVDEDFTKNVIMLDIYDCEGLCRQELQKDKMFLRAIKYADSVIWIDDYLAKIKFF